MSHDQRSGYTERRIEAVVRRPGGWALRLGGGCRPVFVAEAEVTQPPAAGDVLRTYSDERRQVVRREA